MVLNCSSFKILIQLQLKKLNIFDLSGDPYFKQVRISYYNDCDIMMLFVDLSKPSTFENLKGYYKEFNSQQKGRINILQLLIATKADKSFNNSFQDKLKQFARQKNINLFITSSELDSEVDSVFQYILDNFENGFFKNQQLII